MTSPARRNRRDRRHGRSHRTDTRRSRVGLIPVPPITDRNRSPCEHRGGFFIAHGPADKMTQPEPQPTIEQPQPITKPEPESQPTIEKRDQTQKARTCKTTTTANHSTVQPIPLSQSHLINQTQSDKNKQSTGLFNPTIQQKPIQPTLLPKSRLGRIRILRGFRGLETMMRFSARKPGFSIPDQGHPSDGDACGT